MQTSESATDIDHSLAQAALETAVTAARAAAIIIRGYAPRLGGLEWVEKGPADFVTEVDRSSEACIAETIASRFPDAAIVGEEHSPGVSQSDGLTFVVDPLDGTTNFIHGYPQYSVSIGAMSAGELIAAAVLNVPRGDLFTASAGRGAFLDGQRITVSSQATPTRTLIGTGFPFRNPDLLETYGRQFVDLSRRVSGIRRAGSAALDLADVACGRFDGFWELVLAPWDVAAGILIVREAGGVITDLAGNPKLVSHGPVVAGNPAIHRWLLESLQAVGAT